MKSLEEYKGAILPQQAHFAELYVNNGYNATQAAIDAQYSKKTAYSMGSRLLKNVEVMAYINALDREKYKDFQFDVDIIKKRLNALNSSRITDYIKFDGKKMVFKAFDELTEDQIYAIKGIKNTKYGIELILHDKSWNADMINKNLGLYEKDNGQRAAEVSKVALYLPDNNRSTPDTETE
jgi:phage terminase small subunit